MGTPLWRASSASPWASGTVAARANRTGRASTAVGEAAGEAAGGEAAGATGNFWAETAWFEVAWFEVAWAGAVWAEAVWTRAAVATATASRHRATHAPSQTKAGFFKAGAGLEG